MGCVVPIYLQRILRVRGYDNAASIRTLTSNDIQQLQDFFRAQLKKDAGLSNRKNFFHAFHNECDDFEILPGHVKLLEKVVSYINSTTESRGPGYFNPRNEKNIRKPSQKLDSIVGVDRRRHIRGEPEGSQTIAQTLAKSTFVEMQNETAQSSVALFSMERVTPADLPVDKDEAAETIQSDGSLEKYIMNERVHLIELIRVWMKKHVTSFFEQYGFVNYALELLVLKHFG